MFIDLEAFAVVSPTFSSPSSEQTPWRPIAYSRLCPRIVLPEASVVSTILSEPDLEVTSSIFSTFSLRRRVMPSRRMW